jgi:glycopeptide antibiotics resistance protein
MIDYVIQVLISILIATPLYLLLRRPWRFNDKREIPLAIFTIYFICLLGVTLNGVYAMPAEMINSAIQTIHNKIDCNFIPFRTVKTFWVWGNVEFFIINIISNVIIFIPWGFGLPLLWKKNQNIIRLLSLCLALTVFIEFVQLFIQRKTDIDDVILNFLGGCIGAVIYFAVAKKHPQIKKFNKS